MSSVEANISSKCYSYLLSCFKEFKIRCRVPADLTHIYSLILNNVVIFSLTNKPTFTECIEVKPHLAKFTTTKHQALVTDALRGSSLNWLPELMTEE